LLMDKGERWLGD